MFFQLVASLRQDATLLRLRSTVAGGANLKAGQNERSLAKREVVTTTVGVNLVEPKQACPDGVTMDTSGKCCGVGETTVNGVCCPAGVTATSSFNEEMLCPGPDCGAQSVWIHVLLSSTDHGSVQ
jgi:hypothetical protein